MDSDDDFGCLGIPTPLEIYKHQVVLLTTEIEEYQDDVRRLRANVAQLVEINETVTTERDRLQRDLRKASTELSESNRELSRVKNTLNGYQWGESRAAAEAAGKDRDH